MKKTTFRLLFGSFIASAFFFGCSKSEQTSPKTTVAVPEFTLANGQHYYGCLFTPKEQLAALPHYTETRKEIIQALPSTVTLAHPPVGNQGQQGSCCGWGGCNTDAIYYYYKAGLTSWSKATDIMSASFIYNAIKVSTCADGAYVSNVVSYLESTGDCIYNDMTYTDVSCSAKPGSAATINAATHKITSYAAITPSDLTSIKTALSQHHPVLIGIDADNAFEALNTTNYTWAVNSTTILGGHCNTLYGYDDNKGVFLSLNQWGTSWGNAGVYYISYKLFQATGANVRIEEAYSVQ